MALGYGKASDYTGNPESALGILNLKIKIKTKG